MCYEADCKKMRNYMHRNMSGIGRGRSSKVWHLKGLETETCLGLVTGQGLGFGVSDRAGLRVWG